MTTQVKLYLGVVAVLALALFGIYEHHSGVVAGRVSQKIAVDNQSLTTAHTATTEATVNAEKFDARVADAHANTEKARTASASVRSKIAITPKGVTVDGDSTPSVVIPALVEVIHYQDSLQVRSDSELKAQQFRHVADTVMVGAAKREAQVATKLANDQAGISAPRCGAKCGAALTIGAIIASGFVLHHFGVHF